MEIDTMVVTYNQGGGLSPYLYIDALLTTRLEEYGSAVKTIEIYPRLASRTRRFLPTLGDLFDRWHADLGKLPFIVFRRRLQRVEIAFLSKHFNAGDIEDWRFTPERIRLAGDEIFEALQLLKKRIKPTDPFDVVRFLSDVRAALDNQISSMKEWDAIRQLADQQRKAIDDAKGPWEQLEIDWGLFHPRAREILDDPFYWDCVDDIAPHGNDTGADLLEDFRRWNKRNVKTSPLVFLETTSKNMGIEPFDWSITNKSEVLKIDKERSIEMGICNEAAIALAFAVLKMRASCPAEVVDLAKCALERTSIVVMASSLKDEIKAEWDVGIKRMKSKLESLPPGP